MGKYAALTAIGTFAILNPKKAQAQSMPHNQRINILMLPGTYFVNLLTMNRLLVLHFFF